MVSDGAMRASDRDREHAAEVLCDAYAVGRLDLNEFHKRAGAAYVAKTWGELRDLTADLLARQALSGDVSAVDSPTGIARLAYTPRPTASVWVTVVVWLFIAVAAHTTAVGSAVLLSLLVLRAVRWAVPAWRPCCRPAMQAKHAQPAALRGEEE